MKLNSWLAAADFPRILQFGLLFTLSNVAHATSFTPVPAANLDLSRLGRVGLVGDYSGISLFQFEGQNENGFNTNGSQSVLSRFPNGGFASLAEADMGILTMCSFVMHDGTMAGVIVGGNFTSLGGIESAGAAMINPNTSAIIPLTGISGTVSALLCDEATNTVYVGGNLKAANSTNAIAWVGTAGWTNLPFNGFNGPVTSIAKASNGHIVFGGSFTGLGNATGPSLPDQQIINISGANITSGASTSTTGFSDPSNIVCKTDDVDGVGNTWLLADNTNGFWKASFGFGFEPTMLRLYNTHQDGRGTKTWRYTALPINGIMNFTYIDPATNQNMSCSSECPLSNDPNVKFQDFHFVNVIGMNAFQVDISAWYGNGGGLDGIALFENDIFAYAINTFNEPSCSGNLTASTATSTGPWQITPSGQSGSEYLSASVTDASSASVTFLPDIQQSGNYSVNIYTPGCVQDNTCSNRGRVNITGVLASSTIGAGFTSNIYQTNNFDKYDQIYFGYIEAGSSSFRPSITLAPASGQDGQNLTIVAQRVGFTLISGGGGGLNNIFEYDPTQAVIDTADFVNSTFDKAGLTLPTGSGVNQIQTLADTMYVGGNFSTDAYDNIFEITSSGPAPLAAKGLNGEVLSMFLNGTILYVGGQFTNTSTGESVGLNNIAAYDTSKNAWNALGAGVNGPVTSIVPLSLNVTSGNLEIVITMTGDFDQILAFGSNSSVPVDGFAVWVPSHSNWLQNLDFATMAIDGVLTASVDLPGGGSLLAGSLTSSQIGANGASTLTSNSIGGLPVHIQPSTASGSLSKRVTTNQNVSGVVTGLFYENGGRNVTILGGHFTATGSNGSDINNLLFLNGSNSDAVTGVGSALSSDSTITALALQADTLYAGGSLTGTVNGGSINGLISYDLITDSFPTQPPSVVGGDVNVISTRASTGDVFVGGSFLSAGSLACPGVCVFSTSVSQWDRPGNSVAGVANAMVWSSPTKLIVGGALLLDGRNVSLATYDATSQNWTAANGIDQIPGPVTALAAANSDASQLWVSGVSTDGSTFLMKYNGTGWTSATALGSGTTIRGLEVLSLTKNHANSALVSAGQTLMITGALDIPQFGSASSALFNGTAYQPFALTMASGNKGGSLSQLFTQKQNIFAGSSKSSSTPMYNSFANKYTEGHIAKGFIVLIALGIALALIFLLVLAGYWAERIRRKREGYTPAPTATYDRTRLPPEQLFESIGHNRSGIEKRGMAL